MGSHIADALTGHGHEVLIFDKSPSPYLLPEQEMVVGDILDEQSVEATVHGCGAVYNLAGIADIDECVHRPIDTVKYNVLGNAVVLEAARKAGIKRFVFASSVYVYSDYGSFYRSSKQACESFIENYNALYKLPYTILRYGSLYGERADQRNGIYYILKKALTEGKISHFGDGEELREFIHVKDAAELSVEILKTEYENRHVVLTGTQPIKFKDLLEMVKEMLNGEVEIEYLAKGTGAHYRVTPYSFNPRVGRKLVKNPFIDLGQGLLNCIAEIYADMNEEKKEEMGLFINHSEGNNKGASG